MSAALSPEAFTARIRAHQTIIAAALGTCQRRQARYADWEPIGPTLCQRTLAAVIGTQQAMQQMVDFLGGHQWPSGLEVAAIYHVRSLLLQAIETYGDALAIALRSYQPVSGSVEEAALYKKRNVRDRLQGFVDGTKQALQEMSNLLPCGEIAITQRPELLVLLAAPMLEEGEEHTGHNNNAEAASRASGGSMIPSTPNAQSRETSPFERTVLIRYRPSPRTGLAVYTRVEAEAAEELTATIRYANAPVSISLPTPVLTGITHSFADIWLGDQVTIEVGPLSIVVRLRADEGGQSHA